MIEKIIHSVEFKNPYANSIEQNPEITDTVEHNYKGIRRICQDLYTDIVDIFWEFIRSLSPQELHEMDDDIKSNGWRVKNISDVENSSDLMNIFQIFYHITGLLPLANGLLIVPDGEAPEGEDKVNMKNLYKTFLYTYSHGLVSLPFLVAIHYYFDATNQRLIKDSLTELYRNLSDITWSRARDFEFNNVSDLMARISFLIKGTAISNKKRMVREDRENAYKINNNASYVPKTEDPLDVVIDVTHDDIEHKKTMHPCSTPVLNHPYN